MTIPLFAAGFRPFFLAAGVSAALLLPAWIAILNGQLTAPLANPLLWHAHEMIFGFAGAMLAGFLTTAVPNWTSTPPLQGPRLMLLTALWIGGRLGFEVVGLLFLPMLGLMLAEPLLQAKRYHNLFPLPVLAALWACDLAWHLDYDPLLAQRLAICLFLVLMVIIGGRVIPFFLRCALSDFEPRKWPALEGLCLVSVLGIPLALLVETKWLLVIGLLAGLAHALRMWGWWDRRLFKDPLLWSIYLGYGWLVAGFFLLALAERGLMGPSQAWHAFTVGSMGCIGLAIMIRASLGHSGRPLRSSPTLTIALSLIHVAAAARVLGYLHPAALAWTLAFTLFVFRFLPVWFTPRADGKPG